MQRKSLSSLKDRKHIERFAKKIKSGRYFRKISLFILVEMLSKGELLTLHEEELLFNEENNNNLELIILLEGSLLVTSGDNFIMRLNQPGDVFGELSIIYSKPKPLAKVISEGNSKVVIFPYRYFKVAKNETKVSVAYLLFSHILAVKLRHATAQSFLKKKIRLKQLEIPFLSIIDPDKKSKERIKSLLNKSWGNTRIYELSSFENIRKDSFDKKIDFFIIDPERIPYSTSKKESIRKLVEKCSVQKKPILVISKYCKKEENRKFLAELGVTDFLIKPFSNFDLNHKLIKFRKDHYLQKELEQVEIEADTDRLTGLANRRKMDEFLEALFTIFSEDKQSFSIIIADIDHFKHYNDTNGHQLGDNVLSIVASILKKQIRRGDLAARYGGEEFVVILPNCTKDNAIKIGNKLRLAIANKKIPFQEKQPLGNLTCTLGVATFPKDALSKDLLIKKADKCLYLGKTSGRNKLVANTEID